MRSMKLELSPDRVVPESTRANIAAELAKFYSELADKTGAPAFSVARMLYAHSQRQWLTGRELAITQAASTLLAQDYDPQRCWVPFGALKTRTMGADLGAKGGYLSGLDVAAPVDILRPWSVAASAGAHLMPGLINDIVLPRTTTAPTATWVGEPSAAPSESPPTIGNVSMSPHTAITLIKFSIQLLRQGEAVESYIRALLLAAVGELLDQAYFSGAGGVAPLGLLSTAGIGTQSGTSFTYTKALTARQAVLDAGGREDGLQWVGTPAVQKALSLVQRFTSTDSPLWGDNGVLGRPSHATKNAPTGALVCGDFSTSAIGVWGPGIRIDIDRSQDFNSGGLVARVMLMCDVAFPRPEAFHVSTSVS
jgi:HK97 family phage major capsid protein